MPIFAIVVQKRYIRHASAINTSLLAFPIATRLLISLLEPVATHRPLITRGFYFFTALAMTHEDAPQRFAWAMGALSAAWACLHAWVAVGRAGEAWGAVAGQLAWYPLVAVVGWGVQRLTCKGMLEAPPAAAQLYAAHATDTGSTSLADHGPGRGLQAEGVGSISTRGQRRASTSFLRPIIERSNSDCSGALSAESSVCVLPIQPAERVVLSPLYLTKVTIMRLMGAAYLTLYAVQVGDGRMC